MSSPYDYPTAARNMFDEKVYDVAAKLRRMADDVERATTTPSLLGEHPVDGKILRAVVAAHVVDTVEQGVSSLNLDSLIRRASDADLAPYVDRDEKAGS